MTIADTLVVPKGAAAAEWVAVINMIRRVTPPYEGPYLHRDFDPATCCSA
ncbi:hypothetical protein [Streptomyces sp. NPDC091215]